MVKYMKVLHITFFKNDFCIIAHFVESCEDIKLHFCIFVLSSKTVCFSASIAKLYGSLRIAILEIECSSHQKNVKLLISLF